MISHALWPQLCMLVAYFLELSLPTWLSNGGPAGIAEERWMATPVACHRSFQGGEPTPRGLAVDLKRAKLGST